SGLLLLTVGYLVVILFFAVSARRRRESSRALTAVALAAFAVSALHLSRHSGTSDPWPVALIGHHASLPLVLVILYQDYRFALDDTCRRLASALVAGTVRWHEMPGQSATVAGGSLAAGTGPGSAQVIVPTNDSPGYFIELASLGAGRRLMSDDMTLLETAAML